MAKTYRQFIISSLQIHLIRNYTDLNSETFGNAYQSAVKAGYSKASAKNITLKFLGRARLPELVGLAEEWADCVFAEVPKELLERLSELRGGKSTQ